MQTFLPYADFAASARVLDVKRLGRQRVEALQIFRGLTVPGYGWRHHPAVRMWTGYQEALVRYGLEVCRVWVAGGRADSVEGTLRVDAARAGLTSIRDQYRLAMVGEIPLWLGRRDFHVSHRSALVRKDPVFYGPMFPDVPPDLPYVWPRSDRDRRPA